MRWRARARAYVAGIYRNCLQVHVRSCACTLVICMRSLPFFDVTRTQTVVIVGGL